MVVHFIENGIHQLLVDRILIHRFIISAGKLLVSRCRVHHDVLEGGIFALEGGKLPVYIGQDLSEQIEDLSICRTGNAPVREMEAGSDCFGAFGLSRPGRPS